MSSAVPIIRQAGEGEQMWFAGGGVFTWKATAAETGGAFIALEDRMVQGKTTPMHLHPNEDEAIYVLEGELLVDIEGDAASRRPRRPVRRAARCPARIHGHLRDRTRADLADARRPGSPSTATRASRSARRRTRHGRPTGRGCAPRRSGLRASRCSARRRSTPSRSGRSARPPRCRTSLGARTVVSHRAVTMDMISLTGRGRPSGYRVPCFVKEPPA